METIKKYYNDFETIENRLIHHAKLLNLKVSTIKSFASEVTSCTFDYYIAKSGTTGKQSAFRSNILSKDVILRHLSANF
jgi:hypothetical protein